MARGMWVVILCILLLACDDRAPNNPYPKSEQGKNILYSSFAERPKTLDPAKSYSSNEYQFIGQIYEPPLQYHFLKRPFTLVPLTAKALPKAEYFNKQGQKLSQDAPADAVAYTLYTIDIKPGVRFQPHPAFAKDAEDKYYYHDLAEDFIEEQGIDKPSEFKHLGSRKLTAEDYVYQIKRLAHPYLSSPIYGLMSKYIAGFSDYGTVLRKAYDKKVDADGKQAYLDLREFPLEGVKALGPYRYQIKIKGKYPQFLYWLAMPFFSPTAWEVDKFYSQKGMEEHNINLGWFPVGTGPYMLTDNDPNKQMVLQKNPHYHRETYPSVGMPDDKAKGLLDDSGKRLPFIDKVVYSLEKESIPRWNKFLQGYYDLSGIGADSFEQAIHISPSGEAELSDEMKAQGISLKSSVDPSVFYFGFNMLDDTVGGSSERARKLRLAISIILNMEEYIAIFMNGRGFAAQGPLPPGIAGHEHGKAGMNSHVYNWKNGELTRKSLDQAKALLLAAGYSGGIDPSTAKPLILNYDVPASSGPDDKARLDWMRKQFSKLGLQLNIRATQYNRFQEKMRSGNSQIFFWGWHADYPDPENFLFLLYGPNSKVKKGGENASNYRSAKYDQMFEKMKNMQPGKERQALIKKMITLLQHDAPWVWGFYPKTLVLSHQWKGNNKPTQIGNNTLKYAKIDPKLRDRLRSEWNKPMLWPLILVIVLLVCAFIPVLLSYLRREHRASKRID